MHIQLPLHFTPFPYFRPPPPPPPGPVSLLSGLNPKPSVLVMHFFMVALYGVGRLLLPRPTLRGVWMSVCLLLVASRIILPIIWNEGLRAIFLPKLEPLPKEGIKRVQSKASTRVVT